MSSKQPFARRIVIAFVLLTLWVLLQGYRIVTGQSRQFMMELVVHSL